jgi:beta-barrel assembly-enhancing protease
MWESTDFQGGVFADEIDGGRAGAELELSHDGITARTADGSAFFLAFSECQLEMGGASGHMVFCRNQNRSLTIFCEDRRFPQALEHVSAGLLSEELQNIMHRRRSRRRAGRALFVTAALALAAVAVGGYFAVMAGAQAAVQALPMSIDEKIGSAAFESMDLGGARVEDQDLQDAIQKIVDRLQPQTAVEDITFKVHLVDAPTVNAFALPGGQIVVYTGLISKSTTPEHVAGVLAHEMAHVTFRHGLERIAQSIGVVVAVNLVLGDASGLIAIGGEVLKTTTINSYSRDQESDADAEGVRILHEAGIDPIALADFFEIMNDKGHDELSQLVSWISTHPDHKTRIRNIKQHVSALTPRKYEPFALDWDNVLQRVQRMNVDAEDPAANHREPLPE